MESTNKKRYEVLEKLDFCYKTE